MNKSLLLVAAAPLAGCMVGPNYRAPQTALPGRYAHVEAAAPERSPRRPDHLDDWWRLFGDPTLDGLIAQAEAANLDIRIAQARVAETLAAEGVARAALYPRADADADFSRMRQSGGSYLGQELGLSGRPLTDDFREFGGGFAWEIDLFGATRRAVEAARADAAASVEAGRAVRIEVLAQVGLTYLDLRGAQRRIAVAEENLRLEERTLDLTRGLFRSGMANELDVERARAQADDTRSGIPPLIEAERAAAFRLAVLLGRRPEELEARLEAPEPIPAAPPRVPVGLPSDLLRRRPDIRRAERALAAATARVGEATADLFPKFYLTGAANLQSVGTSDLFEAGNRFWALGPSFSWPIFTAGRIRQNIRVQDARADQALDRYEQTVLDALEQVEGALVAFGQEQDRHQALLESEAANRRALQLAGERYRSGLVDFLNVLEAQHSLLSAQDNLAVSDTTLGGNLIRLYAALGGGWKPAEAIRRGPPNPGL